MTRFFLVITMLFLTTTLYAKEATLPAENVEITPAKIAPLDTLSEDGIPCIKDITCLPHLKKTPQKLSTKPIINLSLLERSIIWHKKGEREKNIGVGILIPSTIFATISLASVGVSMMFIPSHSSPDSDGNWNMDFLFPLLFIPGMIGLFVNVSLIVAGVIKIDRGNRMMLEAEEMRKKANKISFNVTPIISPKSKTYGLMLSMRY